MTPPVRNRPFRNRPLRNRPLRNRSGRNLCVRRRANPGHTRPRDTIIGRTRCGKAARFAKTGVRHD